MHRLVLSLPDKIDLTSNNKYIALSNYYSLLLYGKI